MSGRYTGYTAYICLHYLCPNSESFPYQLIWKHSIYLSLLCLIVYANVDRISISFIYDDPDNCGQTRLYYDLQHRLADIEPDKPRYTSFFSYIAFIESLTLCFLFKAANTQYIPGKNALLQVEI